ncbi:MAG TPA: OsmC family protein [Kofleriaceae bacterium]|jgi:osmotically inducible protein OsmC
MALKRTSTAVWRGNGPQGTGTISTLSGALSKQPYGFNTRFASEDGKAGTNPEELLGAAHASCFTMAVAFALTAEKLEATELSTVATVLLEKQDAGWTVTKIELALEGSVPNIDAAKFQAIAEGAKKNCPISRALAATPMTLTATLR